MRRFAFLLLASLAAAAAGERVPVLVELFTSQGCSSCPPADEVLARLEQQQPVKDAEIIVLSEHVDYWNYLGWKDPFSSAQFSARQQQYGRRFGARGVYTPQMIVNGEAELIGSDERRARREIERAVKSEPLAAVTIALTERIQITVQRTGPGSPAATVWLAITEGGLSNPVRKGENGGRTLAHTGVVRRLQSVGQIGAGQTSAQFEIRSEFASEWKRENLRVVAFVQGAGKVLGAASLPLRGAPVANGF